MSAAREKTALPVRDELVGIIQGLIEDIEDLSDSCVTCIQADTGWCDPHLERAARVDELEAIDRKLWKAGSDAEAIVLVAGLGEPAVTALVARQTGMSERAVTDVLAVAAKTEAAA